MKKEEQLRIAFWNANSVSDKKQELTDFMEEERIDVMLLSETHLRATKTFHIRNYTTYRTDRQTGRGGGTAILVKRGLTHGELPEKETTNIENTGVRIKTKRGNIDIYAIYLPPSAALEEEEVKNLFEARRTTIAAGDWNAKHEDWNSKVRNGKGSTLKTLADKHNLTTIGPEEATHFSASTNTADVLDIAVARNLNWSYTIETKPDLSSDHFPVVLDIAAEKDELERVTRKTCWERFRDLFHISKRTIRNEEELEEAVEDLEERICAAKDAATTTVQEKARSRLPLHLAQLKKEKRKAKRQYERTLHPDDKRRLNALTSELKDGVKELYNENWEKRLEELTTEDNSLWTTTRALTKRRTDIPSVTNGQQTAVCSEEKAEIFADALAEQFKENPPNKDRRFNQTIEQIGTTREDHTREEIEDPITAEEIRETIKGLKKRKAPGREGITHEALKNLTEEGIEAIAEIGRKVLEYGYFPRRWKTAVAIMLPKANKNKKEVGSYRPISLLPAISKVIEKSIQRRLKTHLEERSTIPDHQFGFRNQHTTTQQLARITEDIIERYNVAIPTGAIFLDIEKAFDKVWHAGLIYKLKREKVPHYITNTIQSYLKERKFKVKIEEATSEEKDIGAGVPQGSVLGPLLYNLYTADMPTSEETRTAQFADDTAIYTSNRNKKTITRRLQKSMDTLTEYYERWRIKINPKKTEAVYFDHKKRKTRTGKPEEIKIMEEKVEWKTETKYLGVILDEHLDYRRHIEETAKKARRSAAALYPLLNRKSRLATENKILLIKMIILPMITYGAQIWNRATESTKRPLQAMINKLTRWALDAPWYISNEQIRNETNMKTLSEIIEERTEKMIEKMEQHENEEVRRPTKIEIRRTDKRPTLTTSRKRKLDGESEESTKRKRNNYT